MVCKLHGNETQSQPEYFYRVSQGVFSSDESSLLSLAKLKALGCVISSTHFVVTHLHSTKPGTMWFCTWRRQNDFLSSHLGSREWGKHFFFQRISKLSGITGMQLPLVFILVEQKTTWGKDCSCSIFWIQLVIPWKPGSCPRMDTGRYSRETVIAGRCFPCLWQSTAEGLWQSSQNLWVCSLNYSSPSSSATLGEYALTGRQHWPLENSEVFLLPAK